jgi:hypothetical protein
LSNPTTGVCLCVKLVAADEGSRLAG